jgi:hypothetical protein
MVTDAPYPECQLVCEKSDSDCGADLYVVFEGRRIARRGYPGTPQAKKWVPLVAGVHVTDHYDATEH